jgi:biotin transport system substrate-specific component
MARTAQAVPQSFNRSSELAQQALIVVGASLLITLCAKVSIPLPFTPVPLSLVNFGVLLVGLVLGSKRGFAACALYLAQGAAGLPVFAPSLLGGGVAQLLGPTGGFLLAYPVVAFVAGLIAERGTRSFPRYAVASIAGELVLFASGVAWLMAITRVPVAQGIALGIYPFVFAEVMKVMFAAGVASRLRRKF